METRRINAFVLVSLFTVVAATPLLGSGDWGDQEVPTLDAYFDRLPAKSVGRIFEETAPHEEWIPAPNVPEALRVIASKVKTEPPEKLVAEVDKLLAVTRRVRAREQAPSSEQPLLPAKDLNLLHDVRDALVGSGPDAADYIAWRLDCDAVIQPTLKLDAYHSFSDRELSALPKTVVAEVEKRAADAKGPIRAQWLYLRGALAFHHGDKAEAQPWFEKVIAEFPSHPRAETALFMKGRCELFTSRSDRYDFDTRIGDRGAHDAASATFLKYTEQYPEGRFVADAKGWLGGLAWDDENYLGALEWYIRQAGTPGHPEVLKSAVLMIEKTLRRLAADENTEHQQKAFALVAAHPQVAMGMLYLVLGSPDAAFQYRDESRANGAVTEKVRNWRRTLLPRLASAVAAQKQAYTANVWQPRYLALLIHAASNAGQHEEALRLAALAPKPEENDDLLFAKAIALQRAGKAPEAIAAFRLLLKNPRPFRTSEKRFHTCRFPDSVLENGARIRLAMALRDNHQAGLAVLELKKLEKQAGVEEGRDPEVSFPADYRLDFTDTGIYTDMSNAEPELIRQLTDTLLQFAPISELAAALDAPQIEPCEASDLRALIAKRALAREDFKTAQQMMTAAQYGLCAAALERLTGDVQQPKLKPQEKASLELHVGDAWANARGRLLTRSGDLTRRVNARTLGFKEPDDEMEQSEELVHAWHWWLRAARSAPGTSVAASTRIKVLEAMARLAQGSDYFLTRAMEEDWGRASRKIYDRLQTECPGSEQAKQAVWWTFERPWRDRENPCNDKFGFSLDVGTDKPGFAGYWWSDYGILGGSSEKSGEIAWVWQSTITPRLNALRTTTLDVPALAKEVDTLKRMAIDNYAEVTEAACINTLEDLALFLSEPSVTAETARAYINLRLDVMARCSWWNNRRPAVAVGLIGVAEGADADAVVRERIAKALKDPELKAIRDYLEILDAAMVANHQIRTASGEDDKGASFDKPTRDYPALERMTRDFLKRYPHSRKREVARLLLARAVSRQSWPRYRSANPSETDSGGAEPCYQQESFNPKRVMAPLNDYDKEFPNGRYAADIRNMRASALWRMRDWQPALKLTLTQLDEGVPDLQTDGAFRLANIFAELSRPENRAALLAAIRGNPPAIEQLKLYLTKAPNYRDHPLRFLGGYLQDQLGFKLPSPENQKAQ